MNKQIYIPIGISNTGTDFLREKGYSYIMGTEENEEEALEKIYSSDAILTRNFHITRKVMESSPNLKIIARHGVGVDNIDVETATELGIQVTNTPCSNTNSVAEMTISGMLAVARNILPLHSATQKGDFYCKNTCNGGEMHGKTLGIIGFGHIGEKVARIAALGFEMKILVYKGHTEGKIIPKYVRLVEWDELFQNCDFVSIHIPLRQSNVKLIGKNEFAMMKSTAYLVNTSRGKLVDEDELIQALREQKIKGAYVDVFAQEPVGANHELFNMENVVATPHCGGSTKEALDRAALGAAEEIHRFFLGEDLRWPVNKL